MTPEFGAAVAAREDRHARLRRLRRDQQVRPQGRAGRAARRAQAVPAQPRAVQARRPTRCRCSARSPSRFNDDGVTALYQALAADARASKGLALAPGTLPQSADARTRRGSSAIVPPARVRYLAEIAETVRGYHAAGATRRRASRASGSSCAAAKAMLRQTAGQALAALDALIAERERRSTRAPKKLLDMWPRHARPRTRGDEYVVKIRDKEIRTRADHDVAVRHQGAARSRCRASRTTARSCAGAARERARQLPVHRRRVRVQARERGPDAHVRRRRRPVPHQPALPSARRRHAGEAPVDRVRFGHAVRQRSGPSVPTSTARSATRACRSRRSTT